MMMLVAAGNSWLKSKRHVELSSTMQFLFIVSAVLDYLLKWSSLLIKLQWPIFVL